MIAGLALWRVWGMLAVNDIRLRYRRSRLGQFWLTISMAVTIITLAIVYSTIFAISLRDYLPMIAVSLIAWGLIAGICNEGAVAFIEGEAYIRSVPLPKSVFIYRIILRNLITFGHNVIIAPVVMVLLGIVPNWNLLLLIPAMFLTLLTGACVALILSTLSARFRDLPPIVSSFMQIAFFLSPIMWSAHQLRGQFQILTDWNPFAAFLDIMRNPILGVPPNPSSWWFALGVTAVTFAVAVIFFGRFRSRIAYYL
ncbi:ABC transporter permease [Mesorhizobium sp. 1B3]|uniref:ABC transporter permease n=1 Tax=Mesorhizobium sp. 1B3 TaxID=3243599 RepID=UPI003D96070A